MRVVTQAVAMTAALGAVLAACTPPRPAVTSQAATGCSISARLCGQHNPRRGVSCPSRPAHGHLHIPHPGRRRPRSLADRRRRHRQSQRPQRALARDRHQVHRKPDPRRASRRCVHAVPGWQPSRPLHPPRNIVPAPTRRPAPRARRSRLSGTRHHPGLRTTPDRSRAYLARFAITDQTLATLNVTRNK
jgi:hypothetical protein